MAKVEVFDRPDGTQDILVTPDPVIFDITSHVRSNSTRKRKFEHQGSLVDVILGMRAMGVKRITLSREKKLQVERELRARGQWEEFKDAVLGDT